jgi:hypothetical protein
MLPGRKRVQSPHDQPTMTITATRDKMMAKGQAKSNKEVRKPKAAKPKPPNASNPSMK